jgi:hypothetical protein
LPKGDINFKKIPSTPKISYADYVKLSPTTKSIYSSVYSSTYGKFNSHESNKYLQLKKELNIAIYNYLTTGEKYIDGTDNYIKFPLALIEGVEGSKRVYCIDTREYFDIEIPSVFDEFVLDEIWERIR